MVERSLRMREVRGSMPLASILLDRNQGGCQTAIVAPAHRSYIFRHAIVDPWWRVPTPYFLRRARDDGVPFPGAGSGPGAGAGAARTGLASSPEGLAPPSGTGRGACPPSGG